MTQHTPFAWHVGDKILQRTELPLLMGILNVTPDSFSDGGEFTAIEAAVQHALQLAEAGADIIDVGGESTRPGAAPVSVEEELRRTIPAIEAITAKTDVPVSIDTTKAEVAHQALAAGALIVNDISGMTFDPLMASVCGTADAAVCAMHIVGTPQTMQDNPHYDDVVAEVTQFLQAQLTLATQAGIAAERVCLDPGIGFGKTAQHNLLLMQAVSRMRDTLQRPLLIGHSRKRFLSKLLGRTLEERLSGTTGVSIALAQNGADVLRVHDVQATRDAIVAWNAVRVR